MGTPTRIGAGPLVNLIDEVRAEYWRRPAYDEYGDHIRQANAVRVVAGEILEGRSAADRVKILADLQGSEELRLACHPAEVFGTASTANEVLFDLICEVCWQILMRDLEIRIEDEIRSALAEA